MSKLNSGMKVSEGGVGKPSLKRAIEFIGVDPNASDLPLGRMKCG